MLYYTKTTEQVLRELGSTKRGLGANGAKKRLLKYGPNIVTVRGEPLWRKLIEPFANVFMVVLLIAAIISFFQHSHIDGIIIIAIMLISATIFYIQKFSTERILRALRRHDKQLVTVFREGKAVSLDITQLVPGDVITVNEGEKVPADVRVLESSSLRVDESQLTGESQPISKQSGKLSSKKEVYEQSNMLFQGSFVVAGQAIAVVVETGDKTEFGHLAALVSNTSTESPVQKKIDKLISQIIGVTAAVAIVIFGLSLFRGIELAESLKFVIAVSVSAVPEGLPVAISVILVLGMRRMAAKKALVRSMRALETIGVITTIATDKTGTLTKNKLTVGETWQLESASNFAHTLGRTINQRDGKMYDPLDNALLEYIETQKIKLSRHLPKESFPFDHSTSMSGNLWHSGAVYELAVKGAPETILEHCSLTESEREEAHRQLQKLSGEGYRVIAVAHQTLKREITKLSDLPKKTTLELDGFIGVADILRPEALGAIRTAIKAGVTVRMITGDHFETAYHIGKRLGMVTARNQVFDSRKMEVMKDDELENIIDSIRVFSRVTPERKYRLLTLLKKHQITAMTGDGVNDVPALASAHVGVAMGSGASIAKDAGDIILLDDNFKSIVDAMKEGRAILANIRRMLYYLLSTSAGEVITVIGSLIIGLPAPLLPVQILWVNLVTDTALVIPLGLEPAERSHMIDKPQKPNAPILSKYIISRMILVAITMAIVILSLYVYYSNEYDETYARTIAFSALVVMQWANAFCARSEYQSTLSRLGTINGKFYFGLIVAVVLQGLVLFGPLGELLGVVPVAVGDLFVTGLIAFIAPILLIELHKYVGRRILNSLPPPAS